MECLPPRPQHLTKPVASIGAQYRLLAPELTEIACVDPVETAADKHSVLNVEDAAALYRRKDAGKG